METRHTDYGGFRSAEDYNAVQQATFQGGVLHGSELSVSSNSSRVQVAAGAAITDQGVILVSDSLQELPVVAQSASAVWTLFRRHTFNSNSGGVGSVLVMTSFEDAFVKTEELANNDEHGVVLGWIRYPGDNAALSAEMLFEAPKLRVVAPHEGLVLPVEVLPPLVNSPGFLVQLDENIAHTYPLDGDGYVVSTFTNSDSGSSRGVSFTMMPHKALYKPKYVRLLGVTAPLDTAITVSFGAGSDSTDVNVEFTSAPSNTDIDVVVPDSVFAEGAPTGLWRVTVRFDVSASQAFTSRGFEVYAGPYPA